MEFRRLPDALHGRHLGQQVGQHAARIQQLEAAARAALGEDARQLFTNPLGRNFQDQRMVARHGFERGGFDLEPQPRGETDGAQQPQMIFLEARVGVADGADHAPLQIGAPAHVVEHFPRRRLHHEPVDGEIAAQYVPARVALEMHAGGAPAVGVIVVAAKRGHLHLRAGVAHQHHAEVRAHLSRFGEQVHDALGARVGRDVEILGLGPQQQVAHRAAHQVCLVARLAKPRNHRARQRFGCHGNRAVLLPYANMFVTNRTCLSPVWPAR